MAFCTDIVPVFANHPTQVHQRKKPFHDSHGNGFDLSRCMVDFWPAIRSLDFQNDRTLHEFRHSGNH
jgi:hypothetical protein